MELDPQHDHVMVNLARYHLMVNHSDQALALVERMRGHGVGSEVWEPLEIEALFQKRSWKEFRSRLQEGLLNRFCDPRLQSVGDFWIGAPTSSAAPVEARISAQGVS